MKNIKEESRLFSMVCIDCGSSDLSLRGITEHEGRQVYLCHSCLTTLSVENGKWVHKGKAKIVENMVVMS